MKFLLLILMSTLLQQKPPQAPKNDPTGVWQSDTGTKYDMKLTGSDLQVRLVDGSNKVYLKYEVNLKNAGEVNTYEGEGYFTAKLQEKECRFDTTWRIIVVAPDVIAGYISHVVPDPATCEVKDRREEFTQLMKVK
jgi:hypothetical protein